MDSRADPRADPGLFVRGEGGPGPTARIQDLHMGPIHTYVRIHTYIGLHTYICRYRQAHETKLFHFHRISKNTEHGGGSSDRPYTQIGSATAYTCMLMNRHSGCTIHEHATCMYFKKYMGRVVL